MKTFRKTFRKTFIKKKLLGKASTKKPLRKASAKAQSAMEYLMTYGWAILIISVVLAALFQLGVFNPMTFAPKAPPGSCQVFRPNGPYTTSFINLEGVCSGELPQYVAQFNLGQTSWIYSATPPLPNGANKGTMTAWINPRLVQGDSTYAGIVRIDGAVCAGGLLLSLQGSSGLPSMATWCNDFVPSSGPKVVYNSWNFVAVVLNGQSVSLNVNGAWVNGTLSSMPSLQSGHLSYNFSIGSTDSPGRMFNGSISNVQIYNTSLSGSEIQALYLEGIGGAPIDLQNLVGWWPLNGNANDYSGNGNNGQTYNVNFVSNWYNGYTPP